MVAPTHPAVLALQGSVEPHLAMLRLLGHQPVAVRTATQLRGVTHLVIPGGESTTLHNLLQRFDVWEPIRQRANDGSLAVFGTCAGAILLGNTATERPPRMGVVDVDVERNAYGRQLDSFAAQITMKAPLHDMKGIFIRAPRFGAVGGGVEVLGRHNGEAVVLRAGRHLLAAFHPELTDDAQLHQLFLEL
ncbi:MAG: pyridoxal 5'-phosphate synthase glutaminase subunit PdxT [Planctomycetota bacterium]